MRLMRSAGNQQQMKALLKLDEDKSGKPFFLQFLLSCSENS